MRHFLMVGLLLGILAGASPAAADDVDGVVRTSDINTTGWGTKGATAICPLGKHLMGGGWQVSGATNTVVVDDFLPNTALTTLAAVARGPNGSWTFTTYGICTFFQPGLQRVSADSPGNGGDESATATCPGTKVLVGSGFNITGVLGTAKIYRMRPNGDTDTAPNAVTISAAGTAVAYTLTAYADCADASEGLVPGLVRREGTSATNPNNKTNVTASCEAGEVMIGTGYEIINAAGVTTVNDLRPNGGTTVAPTGVTLNVYETQDYFNNWSVTAYALCAIEG